MPVLSVQDFAVLFGTTAERVDEAAGGLIRALDLRYDVLEGGARDALLLDAVRRIHSPVVKAAGGHRADDWEAGWRENLNEFVSSGYDPVALVPKYIKAGVPVRLSRQFIRPALADFVLRYTEVFRAWLFREYLNGLPAVCEFGCGTGHNLVHLGAISPETQLTGFDWAESSQELLGVIAQQLHLPIRGARFDFFNPDPSVKFAEGTGVLTFGALEQVGADHGAYLRFLLERKPAICVDVVGLHELYDESNLIDYLGLLYHRRRNYLSGYLSELRRLEGAGQVEILRVQHQLFGNPFDDPYSYVVWRAR